MSALAVAPFTEADYPSKPRLSRSEAMVVLRLGPNVEWLRPFAEHAGVAPVAAPPWGYIHVHGEWGESPLWELKGFYSRGDLAWGLQSLYNRDHDWCLLDINGYLNDHECHGVFYWLPTDPRELRLRMGVTPW
ncbi:hypothetical protein HCX50_17050 [Microbacterium oxydans]|uniref:hypothetical protein n=1 Tax=Microbacterium sp. B19(2022) TaxID=2914045 RepID=UPI001431920D|nr:hypothetical protein [Microbacterium sp. B19(2022)]NJI61136.1 hypothetical protein [Microbacterium sp. B19(2022)]